jgi:hypothetical protein
MLKYEASAFLGRSFVPQDDKTTILMDANKRSIVIISEVEFVIFSLDDTAGSAIR